ncbi:SEFIR domain-containing protein (plasmid) [Sinorhizobium medicae]|uniref:SEFIR domain-containing protein n=1 Tax=Sinorhizobium medicae TaxID=110321 RepID=UPI002AF6A1CA|nr:SEFIR domain-containing protein [Sinorhizobium medicae]WQO48051.1 SEFIR domain-containing protein [Sinorhizobium medicae]WQO68408.1 SEFIR domain-containing protein [Sinorhizobium medicae]WQO75468.1 SEFIR domain-containing protein [Sinorhizobium medicae]WQO94661.1 SEFIR domain-containing protein [Sinorhizobium medicae]
MQQKNKMDAEAGMTDTKAADPKLFISYSWTTPDHEAWVLHFAEELTSQGIHVILDKWDLLPGHDANAFMESMVSDPTVTKVLLICDEVYARKSDGRKGGAGTEAQIITPEIYAHTAQDKFAAVVRERDGDGKAFLPIYYKGRIYFDLTDPSTSRSSTESSVGLGVSNCTCVLRGDNDLLFWRGQPSPGKSHRQLHTDGR